MGVGFGSNRRGISGSCGNDSSRGNNNVSGGRNNRINTNNSGGRAGNSDSRNVNNNRSQVGAGAMPTPKVAELFLCVHLQYKQKQRQRCDGI